MAVTALTGIKNGISTIMAPMRSAFSAVFGAGGGPAGKGAGALAKIITIVEANGEAYKNLIFLSYFNAAHLQAAK